MRAVLLVSVMTLSCGQGNPAAATSAPTPTPDAAAWASATPAQSTIELNLGRCPTAAELASVDSSVTMTFASDPSAGTIVCTAAQGSRDLTLLQERAYQAVLMFTWIRFDTPLPWTSQNLDGWFAHAIHGVSFSADYQYSYCCAPGGVIVVQSKNLMVLSPVTLPYQIFTAVSSLAALFIHEARHNEGYLHTCTTGDRAGQNDNTIAELGSWGIQYYFYVWMGTHANPGLLSENLQLQSRQEAETMPARFFCRLSPSPAP